LKAVAFFDVDGTLVPGISSAVHLAGYLGQADAVAERARALADVEVTGRDLRAVFPSLETWLGSQ